MSKNPRPKTRPPTPQTPLARQARQLGVDFRTLASYRRIGCPADPDAAREWIAGHLATLAALKAKGGQP